MADRTIPSLPAAITLSGNEEIPAVQSGVNVRLTSGQIAALASSSGAALFTEQLTVSALNTVSNLSIVPRNGLVVLAVNGSVYFNVGAAASFTVSVQTVHWTSSVFDIQTTDVVYAIYGV